MNSTGKISYLNTVSSTINAHKQLSSQDEHLLGALVLEGDKEAIQLLVLHNIKFAVSLAGKYSVTPNLLHDLYQEALLGLYKAATSFDHRKNVRFVNHAAYWIKANCLRFIMQHSHLTRAGTTVNERKIYYRLAKVKAQLELLEGAAPLDRCAEELGVDLKTVEITYLKMNSYAVPFNNPSENTRSLEDTLGGDHPIEELESNSEVSILRKALALLEPSLKEIEKTVLQDRFLSEDPLTLEELGEKNNLSRERMRQIETKLLAKIKQKVMSLQSMNDKR